MGLVAIDGDDTLWHNERGMREAEEAFFTLMKRYAPVDSVSATLLETERANLALYGYGVKGFSLSLIETALAISNGKAAKEVPDILAMGRRLLSSPVELIEGVDEGLSALADSGQRLMLLTKGDLHDQLRKLDSSGLRRHFNRVEIVAEKDIATYRSIAKRSGIVPDELVMIGNSIRSDVRPVLELGGVSVHVPYELNWAHETVAEPLVSSRYHRASTFEQATQIVAALRR